MKRQALLVSVTVLWALSGILFRHPPPSEAAGQVLFRLSDRKAIPLQEAVSDWKAARVVLVGEVHSEPRHHDIQLEVIRVLHEAGLPLAIGLEMFRRESQDILDAWVQGTLSETAFIKAYYDNWGGPWPLYADIFHFARDKKIPLVGLNISRELTRQVAEGGFASLTEEQQKGLPPVSCAVGEDYRKFIQRALDLSGQHHRDFNNFCEAQLLWDTAMAWHAVQYLRSHPERTVVILAGNGHAWKPGIPEQLKALSGYTYRVILPEIAGRSQRDSIDAQDADYLWID